jgi:hypothetical protein
VVLFKLNLGRPSQVPRSESLNSQKQFICRYAPPKALEIGRRNLNHSSSFPASFGKKGYSLNFLGFQMFCSNEHRAFTDDCGKGVAKVTGKNKALAGGLHSP